MSRIGKLPIQIPSGVTITVGSEDVKVTGPKGELTVSLLSEVSVKVEDDQIVVARASDEANAKAQHGLIRSLLNNAVIGVTQGFEKKLEVNGVGFRLNGGGQEIEMSLGLSHSVKYKAADGVNLDVNKMTITISGIDKQAVGQAAAEIRSLKKPEPYKGKGIKYVDEVILRKAGKAGK
jgi:large subunit ribosomal protein L6